MVAATCLSIDSRDDDTAHVHANEGLFVEVLLHTDCLDECNEEHENGVNVAMP